MRIFLVVLRFKNRICKMVVTNSSMQMQQDLLITGLYQGKRKTMKKTVNSFPILNFGKNLQDLEIQMNMRGC